MQAVYMAELLGFRINVKKYMYNVYIVQYTLKM